MLSATSTQSLSLASGYHARIAATDVRPFLSLAFLLLTSSHAPDVIAARTRWAYCRRGATWRTDWWLRRATAWKPSNRAGLDRHPLRQRNGPARARLLWRSGWSSEPTRVRRKHASGMFSVNALRASSSAFSPKRSAGPSDSRQTNREQSHRRHWLDRAVLFWTHREPFHPRHQRRSSAHQPHLPNPRRSLTRAISPAVEPSSAGPRSPWSAPSTSFVSTLPSSTPHWSNALMPHTVACTKTLCS